ncbi:hypothetical protein ACFRU3_24870 [Streptomyces sp. NPDC056910]
MSAQPPGRWSRGPVPGSQSTGLENLLTEANKRERVRRLELLAELFT